jgi:hypothetical protein
MAQSLVRVFQLGVSKSICESKCQPNHAWNDMYDEVIQKCLEPADMLRFLSLSDSIPANRDNPQASGILKTNGVAIDLAIEDDGYHTHFR